MAISLVASWFYVDWWHDSNPDKVRSTSGLEFFFFPIPPMAGALLGTSIAWLARDWKAWRDFK